MFKITQQKTQRTVFRLSVFKNALIEDLESFFCFL